MEIVVTEKEGMRLLQFGTQWCQGVMRIDDPDRLELEYAVRMSAWMLFHDLDSLADKHLVTLGLGAGSLTKFAHRVLGMRATGVEIDQRVIDVCRERFMVPPDGERLRVVHADALEFMARVEPGSFDVVQVDAYDASVEQPALDTEAFYADCRAGLREGGFQLLYAQGETIAYQRHAPGDQLIVVARRAADGLAALPVRHAGLADGTRLSELLSGAIVTVAGGLLTLAGLPPTGAQIWRVL